MASNATSTSNVLLQQSASQLAAQDAALPTAAAAGQLTPCSLAGLAPAISGAALGLVFGSGMSISLSHAVITSLVERTQRRYCWYSHKCNTTGSAAFSHAWGFVSRKPLPTPLLQAMWAGGTQSAKVCWLHRLQSYATTPHCRRLPL